MPNVHRATITVALGGVDHDLCLNLSALAEIETELKCNVLDLLPVEGTPLKVGAREAIAIVHAGIKGAGKAVGRKAVVDILDQMPPGDVIGIAVRVLLASFFDAEPAANPPQEGASPSAKSPGAV